MAPKHTRKKNNLLYIFLFILINNILLVNSLTYNGSNYYSEINNIKIYLDKEVFINDVQEVKIKTLYDNTLVDVKNISYIIETSTKELNNTVGNIQREQTGIYKIKIDVLDDNLSLFENSPLKNIESVLNITIIADGIRNRLITTESFKIKKFSSYKLLLIYIKNIINDIIIMILRYGVLLVSMLIILVVVLFIILYKNYVKNINKNIYK